MWTGEECDVGKTEFEQRAWKTKSKSTPKNTRVDGENKREKWRKATIDDTRCRS